MAVAIYDIPHPDEFIEQDLTAAFRMKFRLRSQVRHISNNQTIFHTSN
ncbi:hypothetical protein TRIP_C21393 [Candidatus Zixiibacteriota bacterium]|nr:hypothetical protein TRIP_C21393 [candidate division Zixibacteria bacterium]